MSDGLSTLQDFTHHFDQVVLLLMQYDNPIQSSYHLVLTDSVVQITSF